jgi:nucleoside-diphosphate-sugar epimerase
MKILITGGSGYIGSVLVNKIFKAASNADNGLEINNSFHSLKNVEQVTVYDNLMYKQTTLLEQCYRNNFRFVHGDVRDTSKLKNEVESHDVIIPLAALVGAPVCARDVNATYEINQTHIENIISFSKKGQKIIYPNTNSGYGIGEKNAFCTEKSPLTPLSDYGISKCNAENAVLNYGGVTLRLATVFGLSPRMRLDLLVNDFTYKAVNDRYIVLFEKDFNRNYIHVQDVALTFIYMINNYERFNGESFNVGLSDANLSKFELCKTIKKFIPEFVIKYDDFAQDPDKRDYIVSNEKLESTGWKAHYSLESGIVELIKGYEIIKNNNKLFTNL